MIALVGHTSMQLAWVQCLQTSDIISQALPCPAFAVWSGTRSMNSTWRQFCASSRPVLSYPSRKAGSLPGSSFHSLQATSQALQPMHTLVSVKKPYARPGVMSTMSDSHQVGRELRESALAGEQVQGQRRQLVHLGHRPAVHAQVDVDQVPRAAFAALDAQVWQQRGVVARRPPPDDRPAVAFGEDGTAGAGRLAAGGARVAGVR